MKQTVDFDFEALQKKIKKKKRQHSLGLIGLAVMASFLLLIGGRWAFDRFFYDPMAENAVAESYSYLLNRQLSNELTRPLYDLTSFDIQKTGIGSYRINEYYDNQRFGGGDSRSRSYKLQRGKLQAESFTGGSDWGTGFYLYHRSDEVSDWPQTSQQLLHNLQQLPRSTWLMVNVLFEEEMDLVAYDEWQTYEAPHAENVWFAVAGPPLKENQRPYITGFSGAGSKSGNFPQLKMTASLQKKYPFLVPYLMDHHDLALPHHEQLTQHFLSLLKYLQTQKDFLALEPTEGERSIVSLTQLEEMEAYVQKNGLQVYGATLWLSVSDLEKMVTANKNLKYVYVVAKDLFPLSQQSSVLPEVEEEQTTP